MGACYIEGINCELTIVGMGVISALGHDVAENYASVIQGYVPFRRLGELLGEESIHADRPGAWIRDRELLNHRKWAPATMAALHVAKQAIEQSGWGAEELRDCALVLGTSRGNAAGWLGPWPGRRPFKLMAASNTIHSEPASAISIEYGITGPNHVLASGCAAGLDAVGVAMMMVRAGLAKRALAVAVDLPLVPLLLDNYAFSGILTKRMKLDPYHPETTGFVPGEGAAAMAIEASGRGCVKLRHYGCNSDASDPIGIPSDGGQTPRLFECLKGTDAWPVAVSPHATGTPVQAAADPAVLKRVFGEQGGSLHFIKPYTGHTIGASGLVESVILASFLERGQMVPNLPEMTVPEGWVAPSQVEMAKGPIAKLSHGMGGHNALLVMEGV